MEIRRAKDEDLTGIVSLLFQVHKVHSDKRPDIFRRGSRKYNDREILEIIKNDKTPVYVAVSEEKVLGYAFCIIEETKGDNSLEDMRTLYIDDLCVDEAERGKRIGMSIYEHVKNQARELGCYHITLNVWCLNSPAMKFYERCGLEPLKVVMEDKL